MEHKLWKDCKAPVKRNKKLKAHMRHTLKLGGTTRL